MNLTLDQEEKLRYMLAEIGDAMGSLTKWEQDFMQDQIKRYDKLGATMFLSGKQWAIIDRVYEKISDVS